MDLGSIWQVWECIWSSQNRANRGLLGRGPTRAPHAGSPRGLPARAPPLVSPKGGLMNIDDPSGGVN